MQVRILFLSLLFLTPTRNSCAAKNTADEKKALHQALVGTLVFSERRDKRTIKHFSPPDNQALKALLDKNPSLAECSIIGDDCLHSPLQLAALSRYNPCELITTLLEHGADINALLPAPKYKGRTLPMELVANRLLFFQPCSEATFRRLAEEYIAFGIKDSNGMTIEELFIQGLQQENLDEPYKTRAAKLFTLLQEKKALQETLLALWRDESASLIMSACNLPEKGIAKIMSEYREPSSTEMNLFLKKMASKR